MLVLINPNAGGGKAHHRWKRVESRVRELAGPFTAVAVTDVHAVRRHIAGALDAGETQFIAAGGDGTVNLVMNSIVEHAAPDVLRAVKLGAVGLGSSNYFHKPFRLFHKIRRIPCRLNFRNTVRHDVCLVKYRDLTGKLRHRHWVINASVGTTAEANYFFNTGNRVLRFLKRVSPWRGIGYAALRTVARHRAREMTINVNDAETVRTRVMNLGIVKNPNFAGGLRYDSRYEPDSGRVHVHLLRELPILRTLLAFWRLARGKFSGQRGARSWRASRVAIKADQPFALEGDGEVTLAREAVFSVSPRLLQVCT
jgi:diacylglycerol kinase family enzyme